MMWLSSQKISHFINRNKPIQYWVIEPDTNFNLLTK